MKTNQRTRTSQQLVLQSQPQMENQQNELAAIYRLVRGDPLAITPDMEERAEQPELENYWIARLPERKTTRNRVAPRGHES